MKVSKLDGNQINEYKSSLFNMAYFWIKTREALRRSFEEITYLEFNLEQSERELKRWVFGDLSDIKLQVDSNGAKLEERIERI
ncbi:hypothetical protein ACFVRR_00975 [Gottfriedia sp. NPDC057948]|uniref:hypothetical protein n=1 Tax=Gottfriedia sp. NPDC057948 TaxID=3346287 RepID=UPI0036DCE57F